MKILYLDYDDLKNPYAAGGQAYTTSELMGRLSKHHEITVVTGKYPNSKSGINKGIKYVRLGIGNMGYFISLISHWLLLPFYVLFFQNKYDVIIECFTGPFTTSFVPFFANKPLIALPMFFDSKKMAKKYRLPLDIFQNNFVKKYSRFIVMTKEMKKKVIALNPNAVVKVIPGGVTEELLNSESVRGKYALYIGRLDPYNKGLDLLISAWKNVNNKLIIAGNGTNNDTKKMKEMVNNLGLNKKIKFVGRVEGKEKINLYENALFVVQPSKFETFGYVALETLAAGKLLVCFDIPGFKWIPRGRALKIKDISVRGLKKGLKQAFSSEYFSKQKSKSNKKFAKLFNWDLISEKFNKELNLI
jgi:glycogen synthase